MFTWLGKIFSSRDGSGDAAATARDAAALAAKQLGDAHLDDGAWDKAAQAYEQALAHHANNAAAHGNLGFALAQMRQFERAERHLQAALEINPGAFNAFYVLGTIARQRGDAAGAIAYFRSATSVKPDFASAYHALGDVLLDQNDRPGAMAAYGKALEANPNAIESLINLAGMFAHQGDRRTAISCYRRALALDPESQSARLNMLHEQFQTADWDGAEQDIVLLRRSMREKPANPDNRDSPFSFLALPGTTAEEQRRCAENWALTAYQPQYVARQSLHFDFSRSASAKPHIAYLSADFHDHATARLMIEVFERHDHARFTFSAYSYGPEDQSAMSARLRNAFDRFVDIRSESILDSARRIHADQVDILIDLKGYTGDSRSAILALCPAPIQVNYLGYPGTMGADFVDYLIADHVVIPEADQQHYRERIAYLPDSYQPNDSGRALNVAPNRAELGLPEQGIVFCCFNQIYKITPDVFDTWCRLLCEVEGSVLWLIGSDEATQENLRHEAGGRGVAASRLIFAARTTPLQHLSRQQCADLFLDTAPYNAHTTCSDALWAGLPVITRAGSTFASRVGASLLNAIGVPELVTDGAEEYYALALELALDGTKRHAIKQKILAHRNSFPLFDSTRFTRNLEQLYLEMLNSEKERGKEVRIVVVAPHGYAHSRAFDEIAETLLHGFVALGYKVTLAKNTYDRHVMNVILGANLLTPETAALVPHKAIIYNLEQIYPDSPWMTHTMRELFGRHEIWDYSRRNVAVIKGMIPQAQVKFVPVGTMPQMNRIIEQENLDIDVLFYGSLNDRRRHILDELRRRGVKVEAAFGVYGTERDALIARAKLVLNMRLYESDIFEVVRVSYLLANGKVVVSEYSDATDIEEDLRPAVALAAYESLVETCLNLLEDHDARVALARQGQRIMAERVEHDLLDAAMATNA